MITAKIFRNSRGAVSGFEISGHAGNAEHGGDIVCAAVSAIAYTAAGYFSEKKCGEKPFEYSEREGFMKLSAPQIGTEASEDRAAADAVLEAAVIGLKQIALSYGTEYIKVID